MHVIKTSDPLVAAQKLVDTIKAGREQKQLVVWLVSGGSAIGVAVTAQKLLDSTDHVVVMQVDERYGTPGHENSNWQQLKDAGFDERAIFSQPVLCGKDLVKTATRYADLLYEATQENAYIVGLFGIGADGHTAGILPHSPAVDSDALVASYEGPDYTRITTTPKFFTHIDSAIVYATGESKVPALKNLEKDLPIAEQPAQLFKQIPDAWIFNDQIGEAA